MPFAFGILFCWGLIWWETVNNVITIVPTGSRSMLLLQLQLATDSSFGAVHIIFLSLSGFNNKNSSYIEETKETKKTVAGSISRYTQMLLSGRILAVILVFQNPRSTTDRIGFINDGLPDLQTFKRKCLRGNFFGGAQGWGVIGHCVCISVSFKSKNGSKMNNGKTLHNISVVIIMVQK